MLEVEKHNPERLSISPFDSGYYPFGSTAEVVPSVERSFQLELDKYPVLSSEQLIQAFKLREERYPIESQVNPENQDLERQKTLDLLKNDPEFNSKISPENVERFENLFSVSRTLEDLIFYSNLRLLWMAAAKTKGLTFMERLQEGSTGLMEAISSFDYRREINFSPFAMMQMNRKIWTGVSNQSQQIRLPEYIHQAAGKIRKAKNEYPEGGESVSMEEIVKSLKMRGGEVAEKMAVDLQDRGFESRMNSLDRQLINGEDSDSFGDLIPDENVDVEAEALAVVESDELQQAIALISEKHKKILIESFGLFGQPSKSQTNIGQELGVSRAAVQQMQQRALVSLREILQNKGFGVEETVVWENDDDLSREVLNVDSAKYIDLVINLVSNTIGISAEDIRGKKRDRELVEARGIISSLIGINLEISYRTIGEALGGRDRSTILNQLEITEKRLNQDIQLKDLFQRLKKELLKMVKDNS